MPALPTPNDSAMLPVSPGNTVTADPVVVLLPVEVDRPDVAALVNPLLVTVAVLPLIPFTHVFRNVSVACLRVLVIVQVIAVSAAFTVKVLPLSGVALPVHARVAV